MNGEDHQDNSTFGSRDLIFTIIMRYSQEVNGISTYLNMKSLGIEI